MWNREWGTTKSLVEKKAPSFLMSSHKPKDYAPITVLEPCKLSLFNA